MSKPKYLDAGEIVWRTELLLHENTNYTRLLWLVHEYAKFFPTAKLTMKQLLDPRALYAYMYTRGVDLNLPTNLKK